MKNCAEKAVTPPGIHWQTDIDASRLAAGIGYCRLQTSPLFREDMTRAQEAYRAVTAASKPALAL